MIPVLLLACELSPQGMVWIADGAVRAGQVALAPAPSPPASEATSPPGTPPPPPSCQPKPAAPPPQGGHEVIGQEGHHVGCTEEVRGAGLCPALGTRPLESRPVTVSGFWIDRHEVTRAEYAAFLQATGYRPPHVAEAWAAGEFNWTGPTPPPGTDDHPVVLTSWYDAREYCRWRGARLPTDAEWELAAHGPASSRRPYPWGAAWEPGRMNGGQLDPSSSCDASDGWWTTAPVGTFPAGRTPEGVEDLFGNAWEWTADLRARTWDDVRFADPAAARDPLPALLGLSAAVRGFSYFSDPRPNPSMEQATFATELRRKTAGLRCARDG